MEKVEHVKEVKPHHSLHYFTNKATGKKDGVFIVTDEKTTRAIAVFNYWNGRKHGCFTKWDKDGNISVRGAYFLGSLDGVITYYENKAPSFTLRYILGVFIEIKPIGKESEKYKEFKNTLKDKKQWYQWK